MSLGPSAPPPSEPRASEARPSADAPLDPPHAFLPERIARWVPHGLIAAIALFWAVAAFVAVDAFSRPSLGILCVDNPLRGGPVLGMPVTERAHALTREVGPFFDVVAIDGRPIEALRREVPGAVELCLAAPAELGRTHVLELRDARASQDRAVRRVELPVEVPSLRAILQGTWRSIAFVAVALVYLFVGAFVWRKKPDDPAARGLLAFSVVSVLQMTTPLPFGTLGRVVAVVSDAALPLYGLVSGLLAIPFTGIRPSPRLRRFYVALGVGAIAGSVGILAGWWLYLVHDPLARPLIRGVVTFNGVVLLSAIGLLVAIAWRTSKPGFAPAVHRRAKVLAIATSLSFGVPSLLLVVLPMSTENLIYEGLYWLMLVMFSAFPIVIGYAIVRFQMFGLRVAIERSAVSVALSLAISLVYVAIVVRVVVTSMRRDDDTALPLVATVLFLLLFSLLQVKVQRWVDRLIYKRRWAYAEATVRASARLARALDLQSIEETVREVLMEDMRLRRAYFAVHEDGRPVLSAQLGCEVNPDTGEHPPVLPMALLALDLPVLTRAMQARMIVTCYDREAEAERAFWERFELEAVVPLFLGRGSVRHAVGFLLLGPRLDGRALDGEDLALLQGLASQLAIAVDNTLRVREIERLKEGLESEVAARTKELRGALDELEQAQVQLLESEKNAVVGRLVAGIVHEINSPIGALGSSADTIHRALARTDEALEAAPTGDAVARARRALGIARGLGPVMEDSVARIARVMKSLKLFVSLDEAEHQLVDVLPGLESAAVLLGPELGDRIALRWHKGGERTLVRCQPRRLNEVFLNLLENAARAIDGPGTIELRIDSTAAHVVVEIIDDGRGIPAARLPELFQFGFTTKRGGRVGLRLGLPFARRVVEELGGRLTIDSEEGRGTRVRVELPAALAESRWSSKDPVAPREGEPPTAP